MRRPKIYLDTSVWNFYFAEDAPDKMQITKKFFQLVLRNVYEIYIADPVYAEIEKADLEKRKQLLDLIKSCNPIELEFRFEIRELAVEYLRSQAIPEKSEVDALHISFASVHEMDYLVSWNMRHIANIQRQDKVHAINLLNGYTKKICLITPYEVSEYENDES